MKKSILLLAMLALMAAITLTLAGCRVSVDDGSEGSAGLEYQLSENGSWYTVIGLGECKDTEIVIPGEYKGLPVRAIGDQAFAACENVTSVVIPESVRSIGVQAFAQSASITSVTISEGVEDIEKGAFSGCTGLTEITVPDRVQIIGDGAFNGCSGLTSITLPFVGSGIERPDDYDDSELRQTLFGYIFGVQQYDGGVKTEQFSSSNIFYLPRKLESVTITGGTVYGLAFDGCNQIKKITVGDGVKGIENGAFSKCKSLAELDLPYINETADSTELRQLCALFNYAYFETSYIVEGTLYDRTCYVPKSLVSVTVRGGRVGELAFEGMKMLETVTFGDGVTGIGKNVFEGCNALTQAVFTKKSWALKEADGMPEIDVSDSAKNAQNLKGEYSDRELIRK
ncbi:MAG: leucine-rich repeat protein [Clostridia bacterium]|nr:leucine-rich repeat protein [Clostridia bacterium]